MDSQPQGRKRRAQNQEQDQDLEQEHSQDQPDSLVVRLVLKNVKRLKTILDAHSQPQPRRVELQTQPQIQLSDVTTMNNESADVDIIRQDPVSLVDDNDPIDGPSSYYNTFPARMEDEQGQERDEQILASTSAATSTSTATLTSPPVPSNPHDISSTPRNPAREESQMHRMLLEQRNGRLPTEHHSTECNPSPTFEGPSTELHDNSDPPPPNERPSSPRSGPAYDMQLQLLLEQQTPQETKEKQDHAFAAITSLPSHLQTAHVIVQDMLQHFIPHLQQLELYKHTTRTNVALLNTHAGRISEKEIQLYDLEHKYEELLSTTPEALREEVVGVRDKVVGELRREVEMLRGEREGVEGRYARIEEVYGALLRAGEELPLLVKDLEELGVVLGRCVESIYSDEGRGKGERRQ